MNPIISLPEVQPNAIVSSSLLKHKNGNVTAFSLDAGQSIAEHTSPFEACVVCLEGKMIIKINTEEFTIHGNDIILLPPSQPHSLAAIEQTKFILIMIKE